MSKDGHETVVSGMQRIAPLEAERYRQRLTTWHSHSEMQRVLREISETAGLYTAGQGELKFVREASIGQICGMLTHAFRIRLGNDPPDFVLGYGGDRSVECEVVGVIPEGYAVRGLHKRYADELSRIGSTEIHSFSFEERKAQSESLLSDARDQIAAKIAKGYNPAYVLVVDIVHDLNLTIDLGNARGLVKIGRDALRHFSEVWFKKDHHLLRVSRTSSTLISPPYSVDE